MSSNDYLKYKDDLRIEFRYACAYCEIREPELNGSQYFWIDHYRPQKLFPHLKNSKDNLIYSCMICNKTKGAYWHGEYEEFLGEIILNPREDEIPKHIDKSNPCWKGLTKQGGWNIKRLLLSNEAKIAKREFRAEIEKLIAMHLDVLNDLHENLKNNRASGTEAEISTYECAIIEVSNTIDKLRSGIEGRLD